MAAVKREPPDPSTAEGRLWHALREVEDPEMPVSVIDMGLIYGIRREAEKVWVDLSFTSMGCPCMEFIITDIRDRLLKEPDVNEVSINVVWDPPWTRKFLTPEAIERLTRWGVTV